MHFSQWFCDADGHGHRSVCRLLEPAAAALDDGVDDDVVVLRLAARSERDSFGRAAECRPDRHC